MLLHNVHIRQKALNDLLETRVFNLKHIGAFEERQSTACLEDFLDDVNDALNWDVLICKRIHALVIAVTVDHAINDPVRLHVEVDMHGGVNIAEEVLIDSNEQLHVPVVIDSDPKG